jgi:hypothetical protein
MFKLPCPLADGGRFILESVGRRAGGPGRELDGAESVPSGTQ